MPWKRKGNPELPTIVSVGAFHDDSFDILLSNGHSVFLELGDRIDEPAFAKLIETHLFHRPQTDGKRLYWVNGPSYTVEEIFSMLAACK